LFVDRDLDAIPASGRATSYTPTSRVCHKTLPLSEFQRPKIRIHGAVEQKPAAGREDRRVVRHARLPAPDRLAGLDRDRVDAADLVFAGGKLADVVGVVDELRPRITIGAVERRR
jgi:hypothetical protein